MIGHYYRNKRKFVVVMKSYEESAALFIVGIFCMPRGYVQFMKSEEWMADSVVRIELS